jgi:hypothetical protein
MNIRDSAGEIEIPHDSTHAKVRASQAPSDSLMTPIKKFETWHGRRAQYRFYVFTASSCDCEPSKESKAQQMSSTTTTCSAPKFLNPDYVE